MALVKNNLVIFDAEEEQKLMRRQSCALRLNDWVKEFMPGSARAQEEPFKSWNQRLNESIPESAKERLFVVQVPDGKPVHGILIGYDIWAVDTDDPEIANRVGNPAVEPYNDRIQRMVLDERTLDYFRARSAKYKGLSSKEAARNELEDLKARQESVKKELHEKSLEANAAAVENSMELATQYYPSRTDRTLDTKMKSSTKSRKESKIEEVKKQFNPSS